MLSSLGDENLVKTINQDDVTTSIEVHHCNVCSLSNYIGMFHEDETVETIWK